MLAFQGLFVGLYSSFFEILGPNPLDFVMELASLESLEFLVPFLPLLLSDLVIPLPSELMAG